MAEHVASAAPVSDRRVTSRVRIIGAGALLLLIIGGAFLVRRRGIARGLLVTSSTRLTTEGPAGQPRDPISQYEDLLGAAERMRARVRPADWFVSVKAKELPASIDTIFGFVRDSIRYEPYAGVLRGAAGTYTSRAGNAVDRALLLARILEAKGIHTRFAIGTLDAPSRVRLFERTFDYGAPRSVQVPTGGARFHERLFRRAAHDYDVVRRALGDHLGPVTKPSRDDVMTEMNPHVWVQAQVGDAWLDLDPSVGDAKPGACLARAERTVSEIPPELYQRLTIRLRGERLSNGELVSTPLLEVQRNTVDLADEQIVLVHQPAAAKGGAMGGLGAALGQSLGVTNDSWEPALWISGEFTTGSAIDPTSPSFVAEWIDFELTWPGGRREVTTRVLVDRAGAAWRSTKPLDPATLRPLPRDDAGPLAMRAVHNVWISNGRHNLVDFTDATQELAAHALLRATSAELRALAPDSMSLDASGDSLLPDDDFGTSVWPFALQNFAWMIFTDHALIPLLNDAPGLRLFIDGPRIAIFSAGPGAGDSLVTISDLRRDDLRGVTRDPSQAPALSERKLRYGILEGALEQEALGELTTAAGYDPSTVQSTSSSLSSDGVALVTPGAGASPLPPGLGADAAARLRAALGAGETAVVPLGPRQREGTWWAIAASTGDTRAVGALDLHVGKGVIPPGTNTMGKRLKPLQQNNWGGQKVWDIRSAEEKAAEARRLAYESRRVAFEERAALQVQTNSVAQQPAASGSTGYTLLLKVGAVIKAMVIDAFAVWTVRNLYLSVEWYMEKYGTSSPFFDGPGAPPPVGTPSGTQGKPPSL